MNEKSFLCCVTVPATYRRYCKLRTCGVYFETTIAGKVYHTQNCGSTEAKLRFRDRYGIHPATLRSRLLDKRPRPRRFCVACDEEFEVANNFHTHTQETCGRPECKKARRAVNSAASGGRLKGNRKPITMQPC